MMPNNRSRKRRRSWLEIGLAGCVVLANPVQGAWPSSFGTVWSSLLQASHPPHHRHHTASDHPHESNNNHHGTQESPPRPPPSLHHLRGGSSAPPPRRRSPPTPNSNNNNSNKLSSSSSSSISRPTAQRARALQLPAGVHEVEIALHAAVGDWGACSPDTCTQARQVFCETRESRIVASDLCGDWLPESERPCVGDDIAAVCGDTAAAAAAAARAAAVGGNRDRDRGTAAGNGAGSKPATFGSAANSGGAGVAGGASGRGKSGAPPSSADAGGNGNRNGSGDGQGGVPTPAATRNKEKGTLAMKVPARTKAATAPKGAAPAAPAAEGRDGAGGDKEEGEEGAEESGAEEEEEGGGGGADSTKSAASSRKQGETPSNPSPGHGHPSQKPAEPRLAASGQLNQMGATGPRAQRLEYRFWLVLAVGAGAVGSFMAVVVFAVGQYRKEQHRLRGITPLNEFPQDNYINPFAKQPPSDLSEHDRSVFKL